MGRIAPPARRLYPQGGVGYLCGVILGLAPAGFGAAALHLAPASFGAATLYLAPASFGAALWTGRT